MGAYRIGFNYLFASTLEGDAPVQSLTRIGGFQKLSGYSKNELGGQHAGLLGLVVYRSVFEDRFEQFQHPLYAGVSVETGNVWQKKSGIQAQNLLYSTSIFVGTETPLGPMYLGFGQAEEGRSSVYFSLGHLF